MKKIRRYIAALLTAVLFTSLMTVMSSAAATAKSEIKLSATSVYVGNQVSVYVTYTSSTPIGGWNFTLNYDANLLQYVSGADSNSAGVCRFANVNMDSSSSSKSKSFTVVFKAIGNGTAKLSTSTREIVGEDYSMASVTDSSRTISLSTKPVYVPSAVNTLSSLEITGAELSPAFDPKTYSYEAAVEYPISDLEITASATHELASYSVSGAEGLEVGENTVTVTVKAENGGKQDYTIKVTRRESRYKAATVTVDGREGSFPLADVGLGVPEGFTGSTAEYNGQDVLTFVNEAGNIRLAALKFGEEEVRWFVFDEEKASFTPYVEYSPSGGTYIILPMPTELKIPDGYYKTSLGIGNSSVDALRNDRFDERYYLVYASDISGAGGLYSYDSLENSLQSYMTYDGIPTESQVAELNRQISDRDADIKKLTAERDEHAESEKLYRYICFGAAVLILVLLILLIVALSKKKSYASARRNKASYHDVSDDSEDEEPIGTSLSGTKEMPAVDTKGTAKPVAAKNASRAHTVEIPAMTDAVKDKEEAGYIDVDLDRLNSHEERSRRSVRTAPTAEVGYTAPKTPTASRNVHGHTDHAVSGGESARATSRTATADAPQSGASQTDKITITADDIASALEAFAAESAADTAVGKNAEAPRQATAEFEGIAAPVKESPLKTGVLSGSETAPKTSPLKNRPTSEIHIPGLADSDPILSGNTGEFDFDGGTKKFMRTGTVNSLPSDRRKKSPPKNSSRAHLPGMR